MKKALIILIATVTAAHAAPMVMDKETGHYKDMSYEALSDEGLSLEQRSWLFGGETVHYGPLTDAQRTARQRELEDLLAKIDTNLVAKCEGQIRKWLDGRIAAIPAEYTGSESSKMRVAAVAFFRAHEVFGDRKYLDAGLNCADKILAKQWPKGWFPMTVIRRSSAEDTGLVRKSLPRQWSKRYSITSTPKNL